MVIAGILIVVIGIGLLIKRNIDSDHDLAKTCISSGRIWINNSCISGR
jgi:hypothetical protein